MRAVQIWKAAVEDKVDFLDKLIGLLRPSTRSDFA